MTIKDRIHADLKEAMRAKDQRTLNTLRLITAAIKQIEVDERISVDDQRLLQILDKMSKQRNESIAQFSLAKRDDLVQQEQFELNILKRYLPEPLSEEAVDTLVNDAIRITGAKSMQEMGKVMSMLKPQLQGRADLSKVSLLIKAKLG